MFIRFYREKLHVLKRYETPKKHKCECCDDIVHDRIKTEGGIIHICTDCFDAFSVPETLEEFKEKKNFLGDKMGMQDILADDAIDLLMLLAEKHEQEMSSLRESMKWMGEDMERDHQSLMDIQRRGYDL